MRRSVIALLIGLAGCDAASSDPGQESPLQVLGAQYRPGPFPEADGGPDGLVLQSAHNNIARGQLREPLRGQLGEGARAAIVGLLEADGAWILPAGFADPLQPDLPLIDLVAGFAADAEPGPYTLLLAGGDADGRIGAPVSLTMVADDEPPPAGELVIALRWAGAADLDIHVVDGLGGEAWSRRPNTWQPPPPPIDPNAWRTGGILDHDGNAGCRRDAVPAEHVIWTLPPPAGEYIVRVDARAMCGAPAAYWYAAVYRQGELLGAVRGLSTYDDTLNPHEAGAGVLAMRFTLP